jgi:hypothetical protein
VQSAYYYAQVRGVGLTHSYCRGIIVSALAEKRRKRETRFSIATLMDNEMYRGVAVSLS